ncbi:OmpL47-type beta-barrel domain-containing protein [Luteimicrobium subarcticum]|uniref:mannan endo-1,4-beta-mannosidase n=1 Tax=Luteimicrobium subarcticum TaxID=620910 RepID=A0A2M8WRM3_9MICO|nr:Ig-like domain repeat protein [Luteimicrobium subarcticum]PJI93579.1 cellulase (glycosyl hydrolase family 5) [Luteimicrobium subarcticum]
MTTARRREVHAPPARGRALTGGLLAVVLGLGLGAGTIGAAQAAPGGDMTSPDLTDPASADLGPSLNTTFVTHDGKHLELDGSTFRFAGTNAYWLGLDENVPPGTVDYPTAFRIRDAIDTASAMGATVVRSHMLVSTGTAKSVLPSKDAGYQQGAFDTIDYAIAYAGSKGIRLVLPLTDNWAYYHGGLRDFARSYGLCASSTADCPEFYSDPRVVADFQDYVRTVLDHVNPSTGLALKDDPTVMAWELGNELEGMTPAWIDTIAAQLRAQAPRQLVAAGRRFDIDPDTLAAKDVDMVDVHYYPPTTAKVRADAKTITDAGKVYIAGEYDSNVASTLLPTLVDDADVTGMLSWSLFPHDDTSGFVQHDDGFQVHYPGDSEKMRANVAAQQAYARALGVTIHAPVTRAPLVTSVTSDYGLHRLAWRGATGAVGYDVQRRDGDAWKTLTGEPVGDAPWLDTATQGAATYRVVPVAADGTRGPASDPVEVGAAEQVQVDAVGSLTPLAAHTGVEVRPLGEDAVVHPQGDAAGSATWAAPGVREIRLDVVAPDAPRLTLAAGTSGAAWSTLDADVSAAGSGRWTVTAAIPSGAEADTVRVSWPERAVQTGVTRVTPRSAPAEAVLVDRLDDLSRTTARTGSLGIDTGNAALLGGDAARAKRDAAGAASATWKVSTDDAPDGVSGFDATAYYWPDQAPERLTFAVSSDGTTWQDVTPALATTAGVQGGAWTRDVASVRGLTDVRWVRVSWPDGSTPEWAQQLGELRLLAPASGASAPPGPVVLSTPADDAAGVRGAPTLTWQPAARAAVYRVTLSAHADLSDPVATTETTATSFAPAVTLRDATTYHWRVVAVNGTGTTPSAVASFTTATRPVDPVVVDGYSYGTDAAVAAAYTRNTGGGAVAPTLVPSGAGTGHGTAMRLTFDLGSPGYAGVTRTLPSGVQDWWGYDGLSLWLDRSAMAAGQKVTVQIVAGGAYWEATLPDPGPHAAGVVTIPFGDFAPPSWASGESTLDLTKVTQLSFYLGGSGAGVLGVDDVRAVRVDTKAPVVTLSSDPSVPAGSWATTPVTVTATARDDLDAKPVVETRVGDGPWSAGPAESAGPSRLVVVDAEGTTTVSARATDTAGNTSEAVSTTVRIDTVAPSVTAKLAGRTVTLAAHDATSGVARVEYRLPGGAWTTYDKPVAVPAGVGSVAFRATDVAGNASAAQELVVPGTARAVVVALALPLVVRAGGTVDVLAVVGGTHGVATGTVTVRDASGTAVGSGTLRSGVASVRVTAPTLAGSTALTVEYTGDATYAPSRTTTWVLVTKGVR